MSQALGHTASFLAGAGSTGLVGLAAFSVAAAFLALPAANLIGVVSAAAAILAMFFWREASSSLLEGMFGKHNDYVQSYELGSTAMLWIGGFLACADGHALNNPSKPQIPLLKFNL